ncbi:MAG: hypothetical protein KKE89_10205 [Actinobacteria bacterium]|nr:hypothetical protein [Actinomycetota bacterium]
MPAAGFSGILKLIHIVFAAAWVGGAVLLSIYGFRLTKAGPADKIAFSKMALAAGRLFAGFAAVTLAAGTWLVIREDALFGFDQAWVGIGFLGIIVGAVLGPAFYAPQARALIGELEAGNPASSAREKRIGMVSMLETILLLVVVWAMVYKPGL